MLNFPQGFKEIIFIVITLLLTLLALNFKRLLFRKVRTKYLQGEQTLDPSTIHLFNKIFSALIFFVSLMLILQILGINIVPLLTVSGIGAAVLGFASKDVVANFFGGVMIYISKPFSIGDLIDVPGKSVMGSIEEIGWYHTKVREPGKKLLYIPNSIFSFEIVLNHSRMTHRLIEEKMRIYPKGEKQLHLVLQLIREYIGNHRGIDTKEEIAVYVSSVTPSRILLNVKAYTKSTKYKEYCEARQEILLKINEIAQG